MNKTDIDPLLPRANMQGVLRRRTAVLLAATLALALATPVRSQTSGAPVGAVTLESHTWAPAAFANSRVNTMPIPQGEAVGINEFIAPSVHSLLFDSDSFASGSAWRSDETFALQDVTPVPEPSTWLAALLALALVAWQQRRLLRARFRAARAS